MMDFFKKFTSKKEDPKCCSIEITEIEDEEEPSCCESKNNGNENNCCK